MSALLSPVASMVWHLSLQSLNRKLRHVVNLSGWTYMIWTIHTRMREENKGSLDLIPCFFSKTLSFDRWFAVIGAFASSSFASWTGSFWSGKESLILVYRWLVGILLNLANEREGWRTMPLSIYTSSSDMWGFRQHMARWEAHVVRLAQGFCMLRKAGVDSDPKPGQSVWIRHIHVVNDYSIYCHILHIYYL